MTRTLRPDLCEALRAWVAERKSAWDEVAISLSCGRKRMDKLMAFTTAESEESASSQKTNDSQLHSESFD